MLYVSKKDVELLIKMENVIGCNEKYLFEDYYGQAKNCNVEDFGKINKDDFVDFMNLIERLLIDRKIFNERTKINMRKYRSAKKSLNK